MASETFHFLPLIPIDDALCSCAVVVTAKYTSSTNTPSPTEMIDANVNKHFEMETEIQRLQEEIKGLKPNLQGPT